MKKRVLLSLAPLLLCGGIMPTDGPAETPGDFSLSCNNISLDAKTAVLTANCKRADGSIHSGASLNLNNYVTNTNGNLKYVGNSGNFSASCSNISVSSTTAVLTANCRRADGSIHSGASLNLNDDITNTNGNLAYVGAASPPPSPGPPAPGPQKPPPGTQTAVIPTRDGSLSAFKLGEEEFNPAPGFDSMPYHLRGDVEYFRSGADIHITAVHIFGWATANGNLFHACGKLGLNAKHLSINGTDYSGRLVFQASAVPQGWVTSSWVATFLGPEYPTFRSGGSVTITVYAAFDGEGCYLVPSPASIASSIRL